MKEYHNYSEKLTTIAKNIFGDIVKAVYTMYYDNDADKLKIENRIEANEHQKDLIDCDGICVVIEFVNGNIVSFTNSEWGDIRKIKKLNIK